MLKLTTSALAFCALSVPALAAPPSGTEGPAQLNLCTASESGNYYWAGSQIAGQAKGSVPVNVLATRGSMENLEKIDKGECDGAIVQSDAFLAYEKQYPKSTLKLERSGVLYNELVHLICNRKAGLSKITKLSGKNTVAIGRNGSGSAITWQGFVQADEKTYKPVQTVPLDGERALSKVADGSDVQCMLFTAGLNTPFIKETASGYAQQVTLVPTDDRDIKDVQDNKGNQVYEYDKIPSGMYALNNGYFSGVDTISVKAILVVNSDWADEHERQYGKLLEAVRHALPTIHQRVGQ